MTAHRRQIEDCRRDFHRRWPDHRITSESTSNVVGRSEYTHTIEGVTDVLDVQRIVYDLTKPKEQE